ncbi:MAG: hypothetical protein AB7E47_03130 [Desulfovibrionaceae bacterium]
MDIGKAKSRIKEIDAAIAAMKEERAKIVEGIYRPGTRVQFTKGRGTVTATIMHVNGCHSYKARIKSDTGKTYFVSIYYLLSGCVLS